MGARKPSLSEQTKYLADQFPPNTEVILKECKEVRGIVKGYRTGAAINRLNEMALIVDIPTDRYILYPDEVLKAKT